ncbi:hypothetical protein JTE90_004811 [Oedothorax gibbosus]|uniref:Hyaluronan/mRNA-binding protein domain-containing protein n=1 Tax=Oedothorax gibbosus TaxID=931172 RepID=A0AAV6VI63_9ARAC|nr:hypothetical protein JTE90_004811 [Oedothorax gibbosus]
MDTLAHGIGVTNRFELFYNEDVDPLEILRQQEEEKQRRKVEKTHVKDKKPVKTGKQAPSIVSPKKPLESVTNKLVKNTDQAEVPNKPRGGKPGDRPPRAGGNYHDNKDGEKNARNRDDQFFNPDQRDRDDYRRGGRGGGGYRGTRGGRGDRGGRGGYVPGPEGRSRRMFDRHSGSDKTGVRPTDKRDGAGPNNWGDARGDIIQHKESSWDDEFESAAPRESSNWGEAEPSEPAAFGGSEDAPKESTGDNTEAKEGEQTEEQMEEAIKEMTLDEYKREQEAKRVVPKFNLRKPGEGEDDKQWKKGYVLKKKPVEEEEDQDEEEDVEDDEYARKEKQKVLLDFQFNFTDSRRGTRGRGRGGRGGPRGGARDNPMRDGPPREDRMRETRGPRGGGPPRAKPGQQAPRVDDINDFPSLVSA